MLFSIPKIHFNMRIPKPLTYVLICTAIFFTTFCQNKANQSVSISSPDKNINLNFIKLFFAL